MRKSWRQLPKVDSLLTMINRAFFGLLPVTGWSGVLLTALRVDRPARGREPGQAHGEGIGVTRALHQP